MIPAHPHYMDLPVGWDVQNFMLKAKAVKKKPPKPKRVPRGGVRR